MLFSATTCGFYLPGHDNLPADAVEISQKTYDAMLAGQRDGKIIVGDKNGKPILKDPPPVVLCVEEIDAQRRVAYAQEADPLFFKAQRGEATNEEWLAKIEEIKARFPK